MTYSKVGFKTVKAEIERIFNCGKEQKDWNLVPDEIHILAESSGVQLKWDEIANWNNEKHDYSDDEFLEIAYIKDFTSENIYIITDECFKDGMAFSVATVDLISFIEIVYNEEMRMEFPQPSDFIFVQPTNNLITMIHHEGVRTKYSVSKKTTSANIGG